MSLDIIYYSNRSENTKKFVDKLSYDRSFRLPVKWDAGVPFLVGKPYVLFVPTYGSGSDNHSIPKSVKEFLNISSNRDLLRGIVGFGNTNFGNSYCKAADLIAGKTGVPILGKVELLGMPEDVENILERLRELNEQL
jgi:protein involved in ribonucleotide reduction